MAEKNSTPTPEQIEKVGSHLGTMYFSAQAIYELSIDACEDMPPDNDANHKLQAIRELARSMAYDLQRGSEILRATELGHYEIDFSNASL